MLTCVNTGSVSLLFEAHYCSELVSSLVTIKVLPAMMSDAELKVCVEQIR